MLTFDEAGAWLDACMEKLPQGIFQDLNGGVNLLPDMREDEDGLLTMGMYITDSTGRRVEIYYGSFLEAFAGADDAEIRAELDETLRHELTHHVESLAGDRSLEKWDERERLEMLSEYEPLKAESLLFVDDKDSSLAPLCAALFKAECSRRGMNIPCSSAGLRPVERTEPKCAAVSAAMGVDISAHIPRAADENMVRSHDAVLCMAAREAKSLSERFPGYGEKIMCLGAGDYAPPALGFRAAWRSLAEALAEEIKSLCDELSMEEE
ncbi:MAG: hypothetical protein ACOX81_00390 [Candidatus Heteroscillospira sp.]|jgi:protein-tyrosine-phosphatase